MKLWIVGFAAVAMLGVGVTQASAIPIVYFDENGNGAISLDGGLTKLANPGALAVDPVQGGLALMYSLALLPGPVVTGDVEITEPGGGASDWMRFTNAAGDDDGTVVGDRMFYYSEVAPGELPTALADRVFRLFFLNGMATELAIEGLTLFTFFDFRTPGGVEYEGISDTPEPASLTLLGLGLVGVRALRRRRTRRE